MKLKKIDAIAKKEVKKEEVFLFHRIITLKKHHQALFALVIALGMVFVWRGLWNFIDLFWFSKYQIISNLTGIIAGVSILYLSHKFINQLSRD